MTFDSRYSRAVMGLSGMVAAAHPLAVRAGLDLLRTGGNAMDACLAMAAVTSVVLPQMCGLGGDAFLIYYEARSGTVSAINGSGPAGDGATAERYQDQGKILPQHGIHSVAVPGAPMVFQMAADRFGSVGLERCFQHGVSIAESGFPVSLELSRAIGAEEKKLRKFGETAGVYMPSGHPLRPGDTLKRPDLALTLREFAHRGAQNFYCGDFADRFYHLNRQMEGAFTGNEFSRFYSGGSTSFYEPLRTDYRGYTVLETAPVSQGFIVLEGMNILEEFNMNEMDPDGAEAVHLMVEAKKIAFDDRNSLAGDPDSSVFDVSRLISKEYSELVASGISAGRTREEASEIGERRADTTSFVAWDAYGNACTFIHSVAFQFGSGLTVPGTGVLLNNRAGRSFALTGGHPNCLLPGRRPMHTLNCYMVLKDGKPFVVGGTPGGDGQPQWNMQMLSLMLDHGAGPQDAVDFPRWTSTPGTDVIGLDNPFEVRLESRFPEGTRRGLQKRGHKVRVVSQWGGGGGAQIIMKDPRSGVLLGGSDRRVGGLAIGL